MEEPRYESLYKDIRELEEEEVAPYLREELSFEAQHPDISIDHLMSLGMKASQVASPHIDEVAAEWMHENPTAARIDVLGSFLMGYWRGAPVLEETVQSLLKGVAILHSQAQEEPSSAYVALHLAYARGDDAIRTLLVRAFDALNMEFSDGFLS